MDTGNIPDFNGSGEPPHKFCGYFLQYPDAEYEGLVSTITDVAPILNWIYVDRATHEVKYGVRDFAQPNLTGPFDCTRQDRRLTLEGWEGFVAVEVVPAVWALYYDRDDNGLRDKLPPGARVLEVELTRREKKVAKPADGEAQPSLDEMLEQQKRRHAAEAADRARQQQQASEGRPLDDEAGPPRGEEAPPAPDGSIAGEPPAVPDGRPAENHPMPPAQQKERDEAAAATAAPAQRAGEQAAEQASQAGTKPAHEKDAAEVPTEAEQSKSSQPPPPPAAAADVAAAAAAGRAEGSSSDGGPAKQTGEGPRPSGQQT